MEVDKNEVIVHRYERVGDQDVEMPPPVQVDENRWFVTNKDGKVVYEAILTEGQAPPEKVLMRGEYVYEWLDRVLAGPLPVTEGGDDMRLVTATRFYEKWPHHINLLKEMESQIRSFADPNARRQTELMIALSGT